MSSRGGFRGGRGGGSDRGGRGGFSRGGAPGEPYPSRASPQLSGWVRACRGARRAHNKPLQVGHCLTGDEVALLRMRGRAGAANHLPHLASIPGSSRTIC